LVRAAPKRDKGLRKAEEKDDVVWQDVDVVGRLVHQRAERYARAMPLSFQRYPHSITGRSWAAGASDGVENALAVQARGKTARSLHLAEDTNQ